MRAPDKRGFDYGDGYDWAGTMMNRPGWTCEGSWGLDGWDLGDWPLIALARSTRQVAQHDGWRVVIRTEGDLDEYRFRTQAEQIAFIDQWAVWFWEYTEATHGPFDDDAHKGPFSWHRLNQHQGKPCPPTCTRSHPATVT